MIIGYRYTRRKLQEREAKRQALELQSQANGDGTEARLSDTVEYAGTGRPTPSMGRASNTTSPVADTKEVEALTAEDKAEQHRRRSYRWKVVLGLFAPFTLQALDTTIVAAAMPTIAVEFSELEPPLPIQAHTTAC